jgi:hypothetical protein
MTPPDESTPGKLRAARHVIEAPEVLAAADAWEADLRDYEILKDHHDLHHKDDEDFRARIEALEKALAHNIRDRVINMIGQGWRSAKEQQPFFPDVPNHVLDMVFAEPFVVALAKEKP